MNIKQSILPLVTILVIIYLSFMSLKAYGNTQDFVITEEIKPVPDYCALDMLSVNDKYDRNNNLCALLIVHCETENIVFINDKSLVMQRELDDVYITTLSARTSWLKLTYDGKNIHKLSFPKALVSGMTYEMSIKYLKAKNTTLKESTCRPTTENSIYRIEFDISELNPLIEIEVRTWPDNLKLNFFAVDDNNPVKEYLNVPSLMKLSNYNLQMDIVSDSTASFVNNKRYYDQLQISPTYYSIKSYAMADSIQQLHIYYGESYEEFYYQEPSYKCLSDIYIPRQQAVFPEGEYRIEKVEE